MVRVELSAKVTASPFLLAWNTASVVARVTPSMSRTGSQYSENATCACGSRKAYVSWLRKSPDCSSM